MADLMSDNGRFDEQVRWLQKSIALDPGRMMHFLPLMWAYMDMGYPEGLEPLKQRMAQISEEHVILGWVDMISSMYLGNLEASMEAAKWTFEKMGRRPMFMGFFAMLHNMKGEYTEARKALEVGSPQFFDRSRWRAAIEDQPERGCFAGWIMLRTGDEEMGQDLISTSINYFENELPAYIDHADRHDGSSCYAAIGDYEKAISVFETRVDHKHYSGWWFMRMHPQFEPLWGTPRFEAAMQKIEDDLAIQRANLARMDTAANF
jgi:tetratricopeptide (TPR) repeat protein